MVTLSIGTQMSRTVSHSVHGPPARRGLVMPHDVVGRTHGTVTAYPILRSVKGAHNRMPPDVTVEPGRR